MPPGSRPPQNRSSIIIQNLPISKPKKLEDKIIQRLPVDNFSTKKLKTLKHFEKMWSAKTIKKNQAKSMGGNGHFKCHPRFVF